MQGEIFFIKYRAVQFPANLKVLSLGFATKWIAAGSSISIESL